IPIVSYESSVDVSEDCGFIFKENSVEEIKRTIENISKLNPSQLEQMAKNSWQFVRENHTRDQFARVYRETIEKIMLEYGIKNDLLTYV
ncbi:MAG: glycosyltransferase family 1 protein, partial [Cyanobacteria bacterium P01_H01_bin.150]